MYNDFNPQHYDYDGTAYEQASAVELAWEPFVKKVRRAHFAHHSSTTTWRGADGHRWHIKDMGDGHLCNTIRMLARRFTRIQKSDDFIGYDAAFAARGPAAIFPVYAALFDEATKRGLMP